MFKITLKKDLPNRRSFDFIYSTTNYPFPIS